MNQYTFRSFADEMTKISVDASTMRNLAAFAQKRGISQAAHDTMLKGMISSEGKRMSAISGVHHIPGPEMPAHNPTAVTNASRPNTGPRQVTGVTNVKPAMNTGANTAVARPQNRMPQPPTPGTDTTRMSLRPKAVPVFKPKAMPQMQAGM